MAVFWLGDYVITSQAVTVAWLHHGDPQINPITWCSVYVNGTILSLYFEMVESDSQVYHHVNN